MKTGTIRIGINACVLDAYPTGVGIFTQNIVKHINLLADDLVVWVTDKVLIQDTKSKLIELLPTIHKYIRGISFVRAVWDQFVFPSEVRKAKLDVVFFPIQEGMFYPPVPQIVFVHDLAPIKCPNGVPLLRRLSYMIRIPLVLQSSAALAVPTNSVRQELLATYPFLQPTKIHVIGEGYDEKHFKFLAHPKRIVEGKYILFVGSRCENKNLIRIIEAFSNIGISGYRLVIVGKVLDAQYSNRLNELVEHKQLRDSVVFLDYFPFEQLPDLYAGAEVLVLPSLYEGFGLPIIEAMACGTPVITSNCSAMPEVAGDAALLVDPYSVESIATAMREIIDNPQKAETLRSAGLERAKMFRWSYSAQKLYDVCRMVSES